MPHIGQQPHVLFWALSKSFILLQSLKLEQTDLVLLSLPSFRSLLKLDKLSILNKGKCKTMDWAIPHVTLGE